MAQVMRRTPKNFLLMALVTSLVVSLMGCNGGKDKTNIELIQDMMDQINVKAQDWDPDRPGMATAMVPPPGTYPRGYNPLRADDPDQAGRDWVNPLAKDFSPQVIELGKKKFDIYCAICHGAQGAGDGAVAAKFIIPVPHLNVDPVKSYADGKIMYFLSNGKGLMGQYAGQIPDERARWAIVNYIRTLQRAKP